MKLGRFACDAAETDAAGITDSKLARQKKGIKYFTGASFVTMLQSGLEEPVYSMGERYRLGRYRHSFLNSTPTVSKIKPDKL